MKPVILPIFLPYSGCKTRCIFCNQTTTGYTSDQDDYDKITARIDAYLTTKKDQTRPVEVAFYGGSFSGLSIDTMISYLAPVQKYLTDHRIDGIRISTRPDALNRKSVSFLAQYGVRTVELGVPSMVQSVLDLAHRNHRVSDITTARYLLAEANIKTGFQLMYGLPGDSWKTRKQTIEAVVELRPDFVRIHPAIVLKDTELAYLFINDNYQPLSVAKAIVIAANWLECLSAERIPVVRLGLQPVDSMRLEGTIVAGPFHPAFGELVRQYIKRKELLVLLTNHGRLSDHITIEVPRKGLSQYTGFRGSTKKWLLRRFPSVETITLKGADVSSPEVRFL